MADLNQDIIELKNEIREIGVHLRDPNISADLQLALVADRAEARKTLNALLPPAPLPVVAPQGIIALTIKRVRPAHALKAYVKTGNQLKDTNSDSGVSIIEDGIALFVESVKEHGTRDSTAVFAYLDGSSGLGKTQLAFALKRSVLYIPLGNSQPIYKCFEDLRELVHAVVAQDLATLREEARRFKSANAGVGEFTATHIKTAMVAGGYLKYFTVPLLLKLLELFITPHAHSSSETNVFGETNVFLGADCEVELTAMTVKAGRGAAERYRDVLIYLDEIPPKDDIDMAAYDECMFLRNMIRCLALPCLLSGTESTLLDVVTTVRGSRHEGREPWAWLLTKFPAARLDIQPARFGAYEQHLLSGARPLFIRWFVECAEHQPMPDHHLRMTPEMVSGMKRKICEAKLNVPPNQPYDDPWLHASTLFVFADSLEGSDEVNTTVPVDSAAQVGEKRSASVPGPTETKKKKRVRSIGDNVMYHSLLIRKHFAMLYVPTELVDTNGMSMLYLEGGSLHNSNHMPFVVKSAFKTCTEDPLLYLACLRGGLLCRGTGGEIVPVPSSYAFSTFRAQSGVGNRQAKSNDGTGLEAECMAAFVLAAHRYTSFAGTQFFRWLALVVAELSAESHFEETEITNIPAELRTALQGLMVPLLSPPNCPWGEESMKSGINFANLSWCKNKDKRDGSVPLRNAKAASSAQEENEGEEGEKGFIFEQGDMTHGFTSLGAEFKDVQNFGGTKMVAVTKKVARNSVCLLIGSNLSVWERKTVENFDPDVSVYRMTERGSIERVSDDPWVCGKKVLIALDLKVLHMGRYTALPHAT